MRAERVDSELLELVVAGIDFIGDLFDGEPSPPATDRTDSCSSFRNISAGDSQMSYLSANSKKLCTPSHTFFDIFTMSFFSTAQSSSSMAGELARRAWLTRAARQERIRFLARAREGCFWRMGDSRVKLDVDERTSRTEEITLSNNKVRQSQSHHTRDGR